MQGLSILAISLIGGFQMQSISGLLFGVLFIALISVTFIGLGLIIAGRMRDLQGFGVIANFIVFPLFLLSGALFPITSFGSFATIAYFDPLTFGVDGLRASLIGVSQMPLLFNLGAIALFALLTVLVGIYSFNKSESV